MNYRDYLQQLIYKIINPLIRGMIKIGITPNFITTTGFILNVVAAGMFVYAGIYGGQNDLAIIGWAGGVEAISSFNTRGDVKCRIVPDSKKDRGTVTEIYYRYSVSVFSCFVIWPERTVPLKRPPASQELLVMCKMNNSQEGTFTCPSGNSFICTF